MKGPPGVGRPGAPAHANFLESQKPSAEARIVHIPPNNGKSRDGAGEQMAKCTDGGTPARHAVAGESQASVVVTPCASESAAPRNESTQALPPMSQLCGGACWDPVNEERQRLAVVARLATTPPGDRFAPITA